jgi:uncharacterized protein YndB with AHSA1/START domain
MTAENRDPNAVAAQASRRLTVTRPNDRELVLTRTFDAPRVLVFQAWTDPSHLARWWGPHGFTNPVCEFDPSPGGKILIHMRGPDGTVYPMTGTVREVVEPERLVFTSYALADDQGRPRLEVLNTVTFDEHDGKTTLTVRVVVVKATPEAAGALSGMEAGWIQTLERLDAVLPIAESEGADDLAFLLTRDFDAPRALVFRAWTEADRLARWFGPKGFTMFSHRLDLRPGGLFHYGMRSPDGQAMWGRWIFREVIAPERLVFVASFSDEIAGIARHPFAPDWPPEVLSIVTFTERDGQTTLTMRGVPLHASAAEQRTFEAARDSMRQGWGGTLDQLAEHLAQG